MKRPALPLMLLILASIFLLFLLNLLFFVDNHIVAQIVKTEFVVCTVGYVGIVRGASVLGVVRDKTDGKT